jgi:hypothetical protein
VHGVVVAFTVDCYRRVVRRISTLTATSLCSALVLSPLQLAPKVAFAQEPAAAPVAEDPKLTEAKTLYKDGEVKFQTAEYDAALKLWKQAYAILPDGEDTRSIRNALIYNIAEAHSLAYEVSRNQTHLRTAKILLERYRTEHRELYGDDPEAVKERAEADDRIAELDKKIAESVALGEQATPIDDGSPPTDGTQPQPQPQPTPRPLPPNQQWEQEVKADPVLGPQWVKGGKQVGGGAVLVSIGGVFTLVGAALIVWGVGLRTQSQTDPDPGILEFNGTGALVSGGVFAVLGIGMLVPGAILIAKGSSSRKEVLKVKPKPVARILPYADPKRGQAGVSFTLRF